MDFSSKDRDLKGCWECLLVWGSQCSRVSHSPYRKHSTLYSPQSGQQGRFESIFFSRTTWVEPASQQSAPVRLCFVLFIIQTWLLVESDRPDLTTSSATNNQLEIFSPGAQPSDWATANHQSGNFLSTDGNISGGITNYNCAMWQRDSVTVWQCAHSMPSLWLPGVVWM